MKKIEDNIHSLIDRRNIVRIVSNENSTRILVRNMAEDLRLRIETDLIAILFAVVPKNHAILVDHWKEKPL